MLTLTDDNRVEIFGKMFEIVGAEFSEDKLKEDQWYTEHSWYKEQREEFKQWLMAEHGCTENQWNWFDLMWGWKDANL